MKKPCIAFILAIFLLTSCREIDDAQHNQIIGSLLDNRSDRDIARDMQTTEPIFRDVKEWLLIGPEIVDLKGWDDRTITNYRAHLKPYYRQLERRIKKIIGDKGTTYGRLKTLRSLIGKLKSKNRSGEEQTAKSLKDLIGLRVVFDDINEIAPASEKLKHNFRLISERNYITNPTKDGYRSLHLIMSCSNILFEIQLRTLGMEIWGEWTHDIFYKNSERLLEEIGKEKMMEFRQFTIKVSDYIYSLDIGHPMAKPTPPKGFAIVRQYASDFVKQFMTEEGTPRYDLLQKK